MGYANLTSTTSAVYFTPSTGELVAVTHTGSSDERLKIDWEDLPVDFVEQLSEVKHGTYVRVDTLAKVRQVGVSAQSLAKALDVAVSENSEGYLSVAYGNAALVAAIQLANRVLVLENKIKELEQR